jgi:hypothetical protein
MGNSLLLKEAFAGMLQYKCHDPIAFPVEIFPGKQTKSYTPRILV